MAETWVVVGASRGIGLEFVKQLLDLGHNVIAGVRNPSRAEELSKVISRQSNPERCLVEQCDVTSEDSINVSGQKLIDCACSKILELREQSRRGDSTWDGCEECCIECRRASISKPSNRTVRNHSDTFEGGFTDAQTEDPSPNLLFTCTLTPSVRSYVLRN
jgi:hypothetical protein